jgi:hypothetical protein
MDCLFLHYLRKYRLKLKIIALPFALVTFLLLSTILTIISYQKGEILYLKMSLRSSAPGPAILYYDLGNGFQDMDKAVVQIRKDPSAVVYTFPIPNQVFSRFRLDLPAMFGETLSVGNIQIVNTQGKILREIDVKCLKPLHQIQTFQHTATEVILTIQDGADDPQISIELDPPFQHAWFNLKDGSYIGLIAGEIISIILIYFMISYSWSRRCAHPKRWVLLITPFFLNVGGLWLLSNHYLKISMQSSSSGIAQLFFNTGSGYGEASSVKVDLTGGTEFTNYHFRLPNEKFLQFRFDPPSSIGQFVFDPPSSIGQFVIRQIEVVNGLGIPIHTFSVYEVEPAHQIRESKLQNQDLKIVMEDQADDPQLIFNLPTPLSLNTKTLLFTPSLFSFLLILWLVILFFLMGILRLLWKRAKIFCHRPIVRSFIDRMWSAASIISSIKPYWLFPLLLTIPVLVFWRPGQFFFILDDWTAIIQMKDSTIWSFIMMPDAEMLIPCSRLVYYFLINLFGIHYDRLLLVNCLLTGVNTFILYLFFKNLLKPNVALALSILYAVAAVHSATAQLAYYLNAILCMFFFLLSLWLTQSYVRQPSITRLLGIGLLAWLSVNSWNLTLLAIWALPLYPLLLGEDRRMRQFWSLNLVISLAFFGFAVEYSQFVSFEVVGSLNPQILVQLPTFSFLIYWLVGALLAPFYFLLHLKVDLIPSVEIGLAILFPSLILILWAGEPMERKRLLWALLFNMLPFFLVALSRHKFTFQQAMSNRYGILTLVGPLLIVGTAWDIMARKFPAHHWFRTFLPIVIIAIALGVQLCSTPGIRELYLNLGRQAKVQFLKLGDVTERDRIADTTLSDQPFFTVVYPIGVNSHLTRRQAISIYWYLSGQPYK